MTTTNYLPLSGPTYPNTLDEQLRTLESDGACEGSRGRGYVFRLTLFAQRIISHPRVRGDPCLTIDSATSLLDEMESRVEATHE